MNFVTYDCHLQLNELLHCAKVDRGRGLCGTAYSRVIWAGGIGKRTKIPRGAPTSPKWSPNLNQINFPKIFSFGPKWHTTYEGLYNIIANWFTLNVFHSCLWNSCGKTTSTADWVGSLDAPGRLTTLSSRIKISLSHKIPLGELLPINDSGFLIDGLTRTNGLRRYIIAFTTDD